MTRTWDLHAEAQPPHVFPPALWVRRDASLALDPPGNLLTSPDAALGGRCVQGVLQGLLLRWIEQRGFTGVRSPSVYDASGPFLVIAMDECAYPFVTQTDHMRRAFRCLALANEPQGVIAARVSRCHSGFVTLP